MREALKKVLGGVSPPVLSKKFVHVPIVNVDLRGPLRFRMLSEHIWGVFLHHFERSWLCIGPEECKWCKAQSPKRWAGFVPSCSWDYSHRWVVKLSASATKQIASLKATHPRLTGLPLMLKRAGSKSNSPVKVELSSHPLPEFDRLPKSFDPRGVVMLVHGVDVDTINAVIGDPSADRWTTLDL